MTILGKTTTVVSNPQCYFLMTITHVTLTYLITHISETIILPKADIQSCPISTLVVQNIGYNQEKQKMPKILPSTKLIK